MATRHGTVPFVPPTVATSLKMTPVQVPAAGSRTSTLPKFPGPCGSECAANRPRGSTRISRTREFSPVWHAVCRQKAGLPGQAMEATSRCWPGRTVKWKTP